MLVSRIWRVIKSKIPGRYKINHYPFAASKLFASQKDFHGVNLWWTFYLKVKNRWLADTNFGRWVNGPKKDQYVRTVSHRCFNYCKGGLCSGDFGDFLTAFIEIHLAGWNRFHSQRGKTPSPENEHWQLENPRVCVIRVLKSCSLFDYPSRMVTDATESLAGKTSEDVAALGSMALELGYSTLRLLGFIGGLAFDVWRGEKNGGH